MKLSANTPSLLSSLSVASVSVSVSAFALLAGCGGDAPPAVAPTPDPTPVAPPPAPIAIVDAGPADAAPAADDKFASVEVKAQNVAGNVYMLQGQGGNIGVLVGDDGIIIVDDEFAPLAGKIRAALKGISDKPIKFVVNTHFHGDHTGGNVQFGGDGPIVAQENVRKRLADGRAPFQLGDHAQDATPPAPPIALPVVTFQDNVTLHLDGEDVRAEHFPSGHTDGDSVIFFAKANVVHMGDDFVTYGFPFVDVGAGGSIRGLVAAVDKVVTEVPADVKVIPGHGNVSTVDDMKKFSAALHDMIKRVEGEIKKKKTLEQTVADKPLASYDAWTKGFLSADQFTEQLYKELSAPKAPAAGKAAATASAKPAGKPVINPKPQL